ncbi:MAG: outer membrane lipoprotein carrier protein LolA [candidate division Zixibacteria bacterium]|nr:outer membrane lipoprotein carrier protein LolA [candidate division Zixibacteria bacterium]
MKSKTVLMISVFALLFAGIPVRAAIGADDLLKNVKGRYAGLKNFEVRYQKNFKSEVFDESDPIKGRIYWQEPNQFRVESDEETIVSDGKAIWTYAKDSKQVTKCLLKTGQKPEILAFLDQADSNHTVAIGTTDNIDQTVCQSIMLSPRIKGTDLEELVVWVDREKLLIKKLEILDLQQNRTIFSFSNYRLESKLNQKLFEFQVPSGAELIDLSGSP